MLKPILASQKVKGKDFISDKTMSKKSIKAISTTLALLLAVSAFTGCDSNTDSQVLSDMIMSDDRSTEITEESSAEITEESSAEITEESSTEITEESSAESETSPQPDIQQIDGITYVNGIMIANKTYSLPADYDPGIQEDAYTALEEMQASAAADDIILYIVSDYRSYETQEAVYNGWVEQSGKAEADRFSARPGHSEHQTGYAFDLNSLEESFADTPEGMWLAENCYKYGFIIRYPKEKEHITGYMYEPWHVRYLGKDIATAVYDSGLTLEEYLGITSQYPDNE